ncbi:MAG: diguanylate cyclase [Spirochaetales bacterium]|nr:diguanylate cyclase [Spirochaetales bacterium]
MDIFHRRAGKRAGGPWGGSGFRLYVASAVPFVAVLVAGSLLYHYQTRPLILDEYEGDIETNVNLKSLFISRWVEERLFLMGYLAGNLAQHVENMTVFKEEVVRFADGFPEFAAAVVVSAEGYVIFDSAGSGGGGYVGDRDYFQKAVAGIANVSDVIVARTTGRQLIIFAAPVYHSSGEVFGVVFAPVSLTTLDDAIVELSTTRPMHATLVDRNNVVIATSYRRSERLTHTLPTYRPGYEEPTVFTNEAGIEVIRSRRPIGITEWSLVVESDIEELVHVFNRYNAALAVTVVVATLVIALLLVRVRHSVISMIRVLDTMSRNIGDGDYGAARSLQLPSTAPGELRRLYATIRDVSLAVYARHAELRHMSLTDPLTSLANRLYLESEGTRIVQMCLLSNQPCSVLVLDIDHFKSINDTLGHDAGDHVLIAFSRTIARSFRAGDFLARYGGEEFVAILPRTGCEEAVGLAERVRLAVEGDGKLGTPAMGRVTISIGVVEIAFPEEATVKESSCRAILDTAITGADRELYRAKAEGRNRVSGVC